MKWSWSRRGCFGSVTMLSTAIIWSPIHLTPSKSQNQTRSNQLFVLVCLFVFIFRWTNTDKIPTAIFAVFISRLPNRRILCAVYLHVTIALAVKVHYFQNSLFPLQCGCRRRQRTNCLVICTPTGVLNSNLAK